MDAEQQFSKKQILGLSRKWLKAKAKLKVSANLGHMWRNFRPQKGNFLLMAENYAGIKNSPDRNGPQLTANILDNETEPSMHPDLGIEVRSSQVCGYQIETTAPLEIAPTKTFSAFQSTEITLHQVKPDYLNESPHEHHSKADDPIGISIIALVKKHRLTCCFVDDLLKILRNNGHDRLPATYRGLMGTPSRPITYSNIGKGEYYHVGLPKIFAECAKKGLFKSGPRVNVKLTIHIDGVSFTKSSNSKGWPITGTINEIPSVKPFLIGLYTGTTDPIDFDLYLTPLVEDLVEGVHGIRLDNLTVFVTSIKILSDSMARLKICHCQGPSGARGCFCCSQVGKKRNIYEGIQFDSKIVKPLRTDASFRSRTDPLHHHESHRNKMGVLENPELPLNIVEDVTIDPMHCTDLGSSGRVFKVIIVDKGHTQNRIPDGTIEDINNSFLEQYKNCPVEIKRRPRNLLDNFKYLKATELKNLALYYGIVILKHLSFDQYNHFLLYSMALRLYADTSSSKEEHDLAHVMLLLFVEHYHQFYGMNLTFNIHMLLHLRRYVAKHGALYSFSSYKYENALRGLKGDAHKPSQLAEQFRRRHEERGFIEIKKNKYNQLDFEIELKSGNKIYKKIKTEGMTIICDEFNCFVALKKAERVYEPVKILYFKKMNEDIFFVFRKVILSSDPYFKLQISDSLQIDSQAFGIFSTDGSVSTEVFETNIKSIACKYFILKDQDLFILVPFLHYSVSCLLNFI